MEDVSFCKQMRKSTRDVHAISDHLVNLKLALALYDNTVWAEGLLVFYEIFKFLEENVDSQNLPEALRRSRAFEADLEFYLGKNWRQSYVVRNEVADYLNHLGRVQKENPTFLLAYVYHLYMGLLSGGQILSKKRKIVGKASEGGAGEAVTNFGDLQISDLKSQMRSRFEELALAWDAETKEGILREGRKVFELNNTIIGSVKSANAVNLKQLGYVILVVLILLVCLAMWNL